MPSRPAPLSRRDAIRRASLLLGAAISAPTLAGVLAGCDRAASGNASSAARTWQPRALSAAQAALVTAMAEQILPRTDTPGATDARVVEFVDAMLADYYPAAERARFLAGLDRVDARARAALGGAFADATPARQLELVTALDGEAFARPPRDPAAPNTKPVTQQGAVQSGRGTPNDPGAVSPSGAARDTAPDAATARSAYRTLKELTVVGYYTSQAGATQELRVSPLGAYRGDVPYGTLGRAWA